MNDVPHNQDELRQKLVDMQNEIESIAMAQAPDVKHAKGSWVGDEYKGHVSQELLDAYALTGVLTEHMNEKSKNGDKSGHSVEDQGLLQAAEDHLNAWKHAHPEAATTPALAPQLVAMDALSASELHELSTGFGKVTFKDERVEHAAEELGRLSPSTASALIAQAEERSR